MCWPGQYSQWSLQTSRAESQTCMKLPQSWVLCSPSSPPWGIFLFKYFFIIFKFEFFFHFSLPSLAWSGEHPVLRGRGLLGSRLCTWLFHQVGSSFWRQKELTGSWGGPRNAPFSLLPSCSTFCFVLHCGAGLFLLQSPPPLSFPAGRKGIWQYFKYNKPKSFQNCYHKMLLEMSKKGEEWRQGIMAGRGVTQVSTSCHSFRVSW